MSPPRQESRGPEITLSGVVERILWLDEDTFFTIAELSPETGDKITILGNLSGVQCGETVEVVGFWERHFKSVGATPRSRWYRTRAGEIHQSSLGRTKSSS